MIPEWIPACECGMIQLFTSSRFLHLMCRSPAPIPRWVPDNQPREHSIVYHSLCPSITSSHHGQFWQHSLPLCCFDLALLTPSSAAAGWHTLSPLMEEKIGHLILIPFFGYVWLTKPPSIPTESEIAHFCYSCFIGPPQVTVEDALLLISSSGYDFLLKIWGQTILPKLTMSSWTKVILLPL